MSDIQTVSTRPVTGLASLTIQLTAARFASRQGESLLYFAGILAYTVASALALTVAGGTWMFWNRYRHPSGLIADVMAEDPTMSLVTQFYFILAVIACALVLPSLVNLASGAAVLGARGRERRLAALRLIGLSKGDVVRMSLLDALVQSVIGTVVGAAIYFMTLPLWEHLTMLAMPIQSAEMLLPAWLFATVIVAVILVGLFAAWRGLRQVMISPLGVARRANRPALSWLRLVIFLVLVGGGMLATNLIAPGTAMAAWMLYGGILVAVVVGINVVAPWFLQRSALWVARAPWPSVRWAARRIVADPAATWRRVSGLSLLAFIGGYMAIVPITTADSPNNGAATSAFVAGTQYDITKGVIITLGVGFVLTAVSMLISQASATIERAEQSQALQRMGAPTSFSLKTMWFETFGPLVLGVAGGLAMGMGMAAPMMSLMKKLGMDPGSGIPLMASVIGAGLLMAAASLLASHPLYFNLLGRQERRND